MTSVKDMTGARFGNLVALSYHGYRLGGGAWLCQCDCGQRKAINGASLRLGKSKSCGCTKGKRIAAAIVRHGHARNGLVTRGHAIWRGMITRCTNPKRLQWEDYGGRGISVCERWMTFENFLADMGPAPPGFSIDRYPNKDGNYEPGNCRWADSKTQANNRRKRRFWKRAAA